MGSLRKCIICGVEAFSEEDLIHFEKNQTSKFGRRNRCQSCKNKLNAKYMEDDVLYLRTKAYNLKQRCKRPSSPKNNYFNKGIKVCDDWLNDPMSFVRWAMDNGWRRGLTIDRIDNDGNYEPSNCRWVTQQQNNRNKANNTTDFIKGTRICYDCKVEKPLSDFHNNRNQPMGKMYLCMICWNKKQRETRK